MARPIAHQATGRDKLAQSVDRRHRMASRQRDEYCSRCEVRNAPAPTSSAPAPRWTKVAKAVSMSRSLLTSRMMSCSPIACAAACTSLRSASVSGLFGFTSTPIVVALGTSWRSSSSRFAPSWPARKLTPVTLPPGRLRLATRPSLTGSPPVSEDDRHRRGCGLGRERRTAVHDDHGDRQANQIGHQRRQAIYLILRIAVFDRDVLALDEACFLQTLAERGRQGASSRRADVLRRNPITGIAGCCARAASGHAAAPPRSVMKSRASFDHLVGEREHAAESGRRALCGLDIDDEIEPRWRCTGRSAGFAPLSMRSTSATKRRNTSSVGSVGRQTACHERTADEPKSRAGDIARQAPRFA